MRCGWLLITISKNTPGEFCSSLPPFHFLLPLANDSIRVRNVNGELDEVMGIVGSLVAF
jgi:hypothetical protein